MDMDKYYLDLKTQNPINYNGLIIYQPSFNEIMNYGIDNYNQIMQIYSLTHECFNNVDENTNLFNDLYLQNESLLYGLSESLYMLTKADEINLYQSTKSLELKFIKTEKNMVVKKKIDKIPNIKKHSFLYNWYREFLIKTFKFKSEIPTENEEEYEEIITKTERVFNINSTNFDDISDIILKINNNKKVKIEKPPANMSERQKDVWDKLQEGRNRDARKNDIHIYDILNICEFGGNYHIPIETICSWSLWRITNCYKARVGIKSYDDNLQIALVSGDGKSISGENHWHHQLMIRE